MFEESTTQNDRLGEVTGPVHPNSARRLRTALGLGATGLGLSALLLTGGVGGAAVSAQNPATPTGSTAPSITNGTDNGQNETNGNGLRENHGKGNGQHEQGGGRSGKRGERGGLIVTTVSADTINVVRHDGTTQAVKVSANTKYLVAGQSGQLSDVTAGERVRFVGTAAGDGTFTATQVAVELPHASGVITAVSGDGLTLAQLDGSTVKVTAGSSAKVSRAGSAITLGDLKVGDVVVVAGASNADGSITARAIQIRLPQVAGIVTAVNGTTLTIDQMERDMERGMEGGMERGDDQQAPAAPATASGTPVAGGNSAAQTPGTTTVQVSDSTTYAVGGSLAGQTKAALSDVKVGSRVHIEGTKNTDGSFTAQAVRIAPAVTGGLVTAVNGTTVTIQPMRPGAGQTAQTIQINDQTTILTGGDPALMTVGTAADIKTGSVIRAEGTLNADGSLTATVLHVGREASR